MDMDETSIVRRVTDELLTTLRDLREKRITAQEAMASAAVSRTIVDAANSETQFIRTVKAIPRGGIWSSRLQYLEPAVDGRKADAYVRAITAQEEQEPVRTTKKDEFGPTAKEWK